MLDSSFDSAHCYAIRRVNPFLGVLQVIQSADGRAISANGVTWDIEVFAEKPPRWGSLNVDTKNLAYYRYGLWSEDEGLVSRPLAPHLDSGPLSRQCNRLIKHIQQNLQNLPFPLQDSHELWLFGSDHQPLALLASKTADTPKPRPEPRYWTSCLGANGVPSQFRFPENKALEAQVKQCAGFNIDKRWIIRIEDGSGFCAQSNESFVNHVFPAFLINQSWKTEEEQQRVDDYIKWIAPSLLTLQTLADGDRVYLENNLFKQAVSIEHHWRLYPKVLDEKRLQSARVQYQLIKAK